MTRNPALAVSGDLRCVSHGYASSKYRALAGSSGTKLAEMMNVNEATLSDPGNPTPPRERRW
ncbi:MAG: hypothetical protein OXN97_23795 [Bryobacterales bacterium]|nr:hypothetical protein [Bryobacterales bacterium]